MIRVRLYIYCTVILLALPVTLLASLDFNANCKKAYEDIVNLRFQAARKLIDQEKKTNPANKIPLLLDNHIDFLTVFISEEKKTFKQVEKLKDKRIEEIQQEDEASPYYLYAQAQMNLQWAFCKVKFGEYLDAAMELKNAYNTLEANTKKFPAFVPQKISLGVLHSIVGSIPDQYKWITDMVGFKGTIKEGINELKTVFATIQQQPDAAYLKTECLFFLATLQLKFDNTIPKVTSLYNTLVAEKNTSPLIAYPTAAVALYLGKSADVIQITSQPSKSKDTYPLYYLDYLHGLALLTNLDTTAARYFNIYISRFKGINYVKSSYQKLAWVQLLKGDMARAQIYYTYAQKEGNTIVDEDKQAMKEANGKIIPNLILLKSRLLFDGGNYQRSLDMLLSKKPSEAGFNHKDILEFKYRLARVYDKLGNIPKAVAYYQLTIKDGESEAYYFAANAALLLGNLYETTGDNEKAKTYYKKCLSMKNHEYQNSIEQKAKAGLARLE